MLIYLVLILLFITLKLYNTVDNYNYIDTNPIKILMIGNSFITKNDMWKTLQTLLGDKYSVEVIAPPSASLKEHRKSGGLLSTLVSNRFDYIVLQEKSINPLRYPDRLPRTVAKMINYINKYQTKGWIPVLYETYSKCYIDSNPLQNQKIISRAYEVAGSQNKCPVAKVGEAFMKFRLLGSYQITDPILLKCTNKDATHPTEMGSLLTALVFYRLFTGKSAMTAPIERNELILTFMHIVDTL